MLLRPFVRNGRPGLIGRTAGETIVVGLARRQPKAQQAGTGQPATPGDPIAQLKELADLKERGALSEEEFAAQKARILRP